MINSRRGVLYFGERQCLRFARSAPAHVHRKAGRSVAGNTDTQRPLETGMGEMWAPLAHGNLSGLNHGEKCFYHAAFLAAVGEDSNRMGIIFNRTERVFGEESGSARDLTARYRALDVQCRVGLNCGDAREAVAEGWFH